MMQRPTPTRHEPFEIMNTHNPHVTGARRDADILEINIERAYLYMDRSYRDGETYEERIAKVEGFLRKLLSRND